MVKFTPQEIGYGDETQYNDSPKTLTLKGEAQELLINCFVIDPNRILLLQMYSITVYDLLELELK